MAEKKMIKHATMRGRSIELNSVSTPPSTKLSFVKITIERMIKAVVPAISINRLSMCLFAVVNWLKNI